MDVERAITRRKLLELGALGGAALWLSPLLGGCAKPSDNRLVFLNWQDYIDPTILADFTAESGLQVAYETYASNDELAERLTLADVARRRGRKGTSFDLIVPSEYLLERLRTLGVLRLLDREIVTSLDNLAAAFRSEPFDPGNRFSVPWATGTTGIGYDTTVFDAPPGWDVFLDKAHAAKMTMLDELRDSMGAALFALGDDPNTRDPGRIDAAADWLIEAKTVIRGFDSATYLDLLAAGELVCAHGYSSDVQLARKRNPDLGFTIPQTGGFRWIDSLCIPESAPNPEGANRFIEYYLTPEVSALNAVACQVDTGNQAARQFIPADVLDNPAIFPPQDVLDRLRFIEDLGETEKLYEKAWARVKDS